MAKFLSWFNPFGRKNKELTYEEQVRIAGEEERTTREFTEPSPYGMMAPISFDAKVLDDEKLDSFFDPDKNEFWGCFLPLMPWSTRLLDSCQFTEDEILDMEFDLDADVEECHRIAQRYGAPDEVHVALDALGNVIMRKIRGHARHGFLITKLTTHRKVMELVRGEKEKGLGK